MIGGRARNFMILCRTHPRCFAFSKEIPWAFWKLHQRSYAFTGQLGSERACYVQRQDQSRVRPLLLERLLLGTATLLVLVLLPSPRRIAPDNPLTILYWSPTRIHRSLSLLFHLRQTHHLSQKKLDGAFQFCYVWAMGWIWIVGVSLGYR